MRSQSSVAWALPLIVLLTAQTPARAQQAEKPFEPEVGQPGKDVVWVPTPPALVEKMMDMAQVGPNDFVIDLGSGDGRNIIAAAKRGANALGVEYNPDMVALSDRLAKAAGVSDKAKFVQGDMFVADFSKATVMAVFLLPSNMLQLRSKFFALAPGSRIVSNTFRFEGWNPDKSESIGGECTAWCEAILWIVPAKVAGRWRGPESDLTLSQDFQMVSGTLTIGGKPVPVAGQLNGRDITLKGGDRVYTGRAGDTEIELTAPGSAPLRLTRAGS
jgi:SAM-dependent methyltransferase